MNSKYLYSVYQLPNTLLSIYLGVHLILTISQQLPLLSPERKSKSTHSGSHPRNGKSH